ncbi:MAG: response regulator transcription factor [Bacteroidota bacterium]
MTLKAKILLVEDDPNLSAVLSDYLEMLEYSTTQAADGEDGLIKFNEGDFDLCILDVMMPKKDGYSLARDIRKINDQIPVVFLTARGQNDDRIAGFRVGCDDYITKPFSSEELALRVEAILKRCMHRNMRTQSSLNIGSYKFDSVNLVLRFNNEEQKLTPKEAALLKLLCSYRNNLLPRDTALKEIWGDSDYFIGRSMDVFIARLRKYLRHDPSVVIQNVHGSGFKLEVRE